jgi:hypothetical protein
MKWDLWKKKEKEERHWFSMQLGNWKAVINDTENPGAVPDMERALVENHNALPAWSLWEGNQDAAWYGVELVEPHSEPELILQEVRDAGFEVRAFVLYGESGRGVLRELFASEDDEEE